MRSVISLKSFNHRLKAFVLTSCLLLVLALGGVSAPTLASQGGPLLSTTWDQGLPYNSFCPSFLFSSDPNNVQIAPTGCVATAMGQLINYWGQTTGFPAHGYNDHYDVYAYGGGLQGVQLPPLYGDFKDHIYNWNNMSGSNLSQFLLDVGISVDMNYYMGGSGTQVGGIPSIFPLDSNAANYNNVSYALVNYFGFSSGGTLIYRTDYISDVAWFNQMRLEIDAGRPVLYLMDTGDCQNNLNLPMPRPSSEGHCIVVDGYRSDSTGLYLHMNFGWGGYSNSWQRVDNIHDTSWGYDWNLNNRAIIGIQPLNSNSGTGSGYDGAAYVRDVTVPDRTTFNSNQSFSKTWQIQNTGTKSWGSGYSWTFDGGTQMNGSTSISVPTISPGTSWTPTVSLTAPVAPGTYTSYWRMQAPNGQKFGDRCYVLIQVVQIAPGQKPDGSFDNRIVDAYSRVGGVWIGSPYDNGSGLYVHSYFSGRIQDFNGGTGSFGAILHKDNDDNSGTAYHLQYEFWSSYLNTYGGVNGFLGWPAGDRTGASQSFNGTTGAWQNFENGEIYSRAPGNQVSEVHGAIRDKFHQTGGTSGFLGFPISDEGDSTPSPLGTTGRGNLFEGGVIHASALGTYEVHGAIFSKYRDMGGSGSVLGFPTSDEGDAAPSPYNSKGRLSHFEGGTLYYSYQYGGYPVYGAIAQKFDASGGTAGPFGFPISDPVIGSRGLQQNFEGGTIYENVSLTFTISPNVVSSGQVASTGTLSIDQTAPAGGLVVPIVSTDTSVAVVPVSVTIPEGASSTTFYVYAGNVPGTSTATVYAPGYGSSAQASLTVMPQTLSLVSLVISPSNVTGNDTATAVATFNGPSPVAGSYLYIKSSNSNVASTPPFISLPLGATSATFTIYTWPVTNTTPITMTGWILGTSNPVHQTATFSVSPPFTINSVIIAPTSTTGGDTPPVGTVSLTSPAPAGGVIVNLASDTTSVATVPATVTIPEGTTSATFSISTTAVTAEHDVTISAFGGGSSQAVVLPVYPVLAPIALILTSPTIAGGTNAAGTITLNRPAVGSGCVVSITSDSPSVPPVQVLVPAGSTSSALSFVTSAVSTTTAVTLSASTGGTTASTILTLVPASVVVSASPVTLTRNRYNIIATIRVTNSGSANAGNVQIKKAVFGAYVPKTTLPVTVGTMASGSAALVTLKFPNTIGVSGAQRTLKINGNYTGGSFSYSSQLKLP